MRRIHPGCMAEARVLLMEQTVAAMGALSLDALPNLLLAPPVATVPVALPATVSHSLQPARRAVPAYACNSSPGLAPSPMFRLLACSELLPRLFTTAYVCIMQRMSSTAMPDLIWRVSGLLPSKWWSGNAGGCLTGAFGRCVCCFQLVKYVRPYHTLLVVSCHMSQGWEH